MCILGYCLLLYFLEGSEEHRDQYTTSKKGREASCSFKTEIDSILKCASKVHQRDDLLSIFSQHYCQTVQSNQSTSVNSIILLYRFLSSANSIRCHYGIFKQIVLLILFTYHLPHLSLYTSTPLTALVYSPVTCTLLPSQSLPEHFFFPLVVTLLISRLYSL